MSKWVKTVSCDLAGTPIGISTSNGSPATTDNALLTKSILSGLSTAGTGSYLNVGVSPYNGLLTTDIDQYGTQTYFAPNGEQVALPLYKLVGDSFALSSLDTGMWTASVGVGGTAVVTSGELVLSTGTTADNSVILQSNDVARFTGVAPNKFRGFVQLTSTGVINNTTLWGVDSPVPSPSGAYFKLSGTTFSILTRKGGVDTSVTNGSFNGQYGPTYTIDTLGHNYEIIYQPRQVIFKIDTKILHTITTSSTPWTDTLHLHIHFETTNTGGSTTNVSLKARLGAIVRFGIPDLQPRYFTQIGLGTAVLKIGPGNLETLVLSSIANNAVVTLYDNTAASGAVIFSSGPMPANTIPLSLPFSGLGFSTGLTISITAAAANATIIYD